MTTFFRPVHRTRMSAATDIACRLVLAGFVALIFVAFLSVVSVRRAKAHSWYPIQCCSDRDCAPVDDSAIEETAAGFIIKATGEVVPFKDSKTSPDGKYHICRFPSGGLICFFRPLRGV